MSLSQYEVANEIILFLKDSLTSELEANFEGLYIFGSLVGGDFDIKSSDIDLLALMKNDVSKKELQKLKTIHEALIKKFPEWEDRIEVAYVSKGAIQNFKTKTGQLARISPGEPLHFRDDMGIDWLMDWHMIQEQGIRVVGPKPSEFIPHITHDEFIQSVRKVMPYFVKSAAKAKHVGYQSYVILSLCRNLYALEHGYQTSKIQGGKWAAAKYPEWASLIQRAINWKGSPDKSHSPATQKETKDFALFMAREAEIPV